MAANHPELYEKTQIVSLRPSVCRTTATTTKGGMRWSKEEERDAQMEDKATVCLRELSTVLHWFHLSMGNRFRDSYETRATPIVW